eukprot:TRINITY_DN8655_c0_g2_i1.p1 TRINITY_DN8655_c0_g2~~TRINITY_DN8655_c0_g2_i1.p1  ORF type:complete len:174 (-),score=16.58 TRINITY_DN8655_c0_g2_i1:230-751(-)
MVGGEDYSLVETMKRRYIKRAGKADGPVEGGYSPVDLRGKDVFVSPQSTSSTMVLVPQPPPKRRPAGGNSFRRKFQSAPLTATATETTTRECSIAPRTETDSGAPFRRTAGRAASRFRARILSAQVQQHKCGALMDFEPIENTFDGRLEPGELISELSDLESEVSQSVSEEGY